MQKHEALIFSENCWFCTATGEVRGLRIWSETQVTGGGGGGSVGPYGGSIGPITITSTSTTYREFWVVEDGGTERRLVCAESQFSVRDGQRVMVVWGASDKQTSGPYLALWNLSHRDELIHFLPGSAESLLPRMGLRKGKTGLIGFVAFLAFAVFLWKTEGPASLVIDVFAAIIIPAAVTLVGQSIRSKWLRAIRHAAVKSMGSDTAPIVVKDREALLTKITLAVATILLVGTVTVQGAWKFAVGFPMRLHTIRETYKEPQGTGTFRNHFYTASEIKDYYSVPWKRDKPVKLIGNNITIKGDLDGADISGMGDMTFNGNLTNSKVTDYYGLITVKNVSNSTLIGNYIRTTGFTVDITRVIDGYFPHKRSKETLASGVPQHNR